MYHITYNTNTTEAGVGKCVKPTGHLGKQYGVDVNMRQYSGEHPRHICMATIGDSAFETSDERRKYLGSKIYII